MSPANTRTVLLIDDELSAVDLYALAIGEHFRVLTATTARAGYALAQQERPDAIVIDMLLPDLHGLDLSRRLSEDARTTAIPRIVLTGDDDSIAHAARFRFEAVLRKPCPVEDLLLVLDRATSARSESTSETSHR